MQSISRVERTILMLLQPRERYGLELVGASSGVLKRGTVYVTLGRMERKGFVSSRQEQLPPKAIGLPRRLYTVTSYGVTVLEASRLLEAALNTNAAKVTA